MTVFEAKTEKTASLIEKRINFDIYGLFERINRFRLYNSKF